MIKRLLVSITLVGLALPLAAQEAAKPLTLGDAFARALEANRAVARAKSALGAAEAQRRGTLSSVLPHLNLTGNVMENSEEVSFGSGSDQRILLPRTDWNYRFTLSQPVYAGRRESRAYAQSKLGVLNAKEGVLATENGTLLRVASDYLGVAQGDALVDVETKNLELAQRRLAQAKSFYEAGESTKVDVLRAEADVKGAERILTAARQQRETSAGYLRLDLDLEGPIAVTAPDVTLPSIPAEPQLIDTAKAERPELQQARNNVQISHLEVLKQKGAYLPVITADAAYISQKSTFPTDKYGQAAVRFTVPIFQSGEIGNRVAFAREQEEQAKSMLDETTQSVEEDVRRAMLDLRTAGTNLALAKDQLTAAQAEYDQTFELFRAQEATSLDVQTAERALAEARRAVVNESLNRTLAELRVWFAAGNLKSAVMSTTEVSQ